VVEESYTVRKEAAEATGERGGHEEVADAEGEFALRVEESEIDG
jgi:hypothetical protein